MELLALKDEGVGAVWALKQQEYEVAWAARQRDIDLARAAGKAAPNGDDAIRDIASGSWPARNPAQLLDAAPADILDAMHNFVMTRNYTRESMHQRSARMVANIKSRVEAVVESMARDLKLPWPLGNETVSQEFQELKRRVARAVVKELQAEAAAVEPVQPRLPEVQLTNTHAWAKRYGFAGVGCRSESVTLTSRRSPLRSTVTASQMRNTSASRCVMYRMVRPSRLSATSAAKMRSIS